MRITLVLIALGFATPALAEDQFLRDLAVTRNYNLGRPSHTTPTPDGASVLFLRSEPRAPVNSLYAFDVATGQAKVLLTPEQILKGAEEKLSAAEKAQRERQRISTRGFSGYQLSDDGKLILVTLSGKLYLVRLAASGSAALGAPGYAGWAQDVTELKTGAGAGAQSDVLARRDQDCVRARARSVRL
jgi:hypothetical protein